MISINANEFSNYTLTTFYEFIHLQQQTHFEIRFPKKAIDGKHKNFDVFCEYYLAAYAGYKLSQIASSFAYYVPAANKIGHFKFEVEVDDMKIFAAVLFAIVMAFYNQEMDDDAIAFQVAASDYFVKAYEEDKDPSTLGLISIANHFLAK